MRRAWWVLVVVGCGRKDGAPAAGSGALVAAAPIAAVAPAAPACDVAGNYRLRFSSNGTDGWWLPIAVKDGKAIVSDHVSMLGLDERTPIATKIDGCTVKLTAHSDTAGDVALAFTLDPKTNAVTGELTRTAGADDIGSPAKQTVSGRRDVGGALPACLKPGVFHIAATGVWKLSAGKPRFGNTCKHMAEPITEAFVRIQPFGKELVVDAVENSPDHRQTFERGKVKRISDCEIHLELALQDFDFTGTLTLDGDKLTGSASDAHYTFMEDGDAGENQWECRAKNVRLTGERIAE